jgi:hypothetical protein
VLSFSLSLHSQRTRHFPHRFVSRRAVLHGGLLLLPLTLLNLRLHLQRCYGHGAANSSWRRACVRSFAWVVSVTRRSGMGRVATTLVASGRGVQIVKQIVIRCATGRRFVGSSEGIGVKVKPSGPRVVRDPFGMTLLRPWKAPARGAFDRRAQPKPRNLQSSARGLRGNWKQHERGG